MTKINKKNEKIKLRELKLLDRDNLFHQSCFFSCSKKKNIINFVKEKH